MKLTRPHSGIVEGTSLALASALAFGCTTPLVQRAGGGAGALPTAFLLYAGALLFAAPFASYEGRAEGANVRRSDLPRLFAIAALGAAIAPSLFAWALQRTSGIGASILLNLEVVFTAALARLLYRESVSRRVVLAIALMLVGGALTIGRSSGEGRSSLLGALALTFAVFAWALDNTLARALADRRASQVVAVKSALGATFTLTAGLSLAQPWPSAAGTMALLACGALGYGASLQLYVLAQRRIGAARTASVFAAAPFVGASLAWALGDRPGGAFLLVAAALFACGAWLHATERHGHRHRHPAVEHDHLHRHDDGHHDHVHDVYPEGEHAHLHSHRALEHDHEHAEDLHHRHEHEV